jgi:hypothetical protein
VCAAAAGDTPRACVLLRAACCGPLSFFCGYYYFFIFPSVCLFLSLSLNQLSLPDLTKTHFHPLHIDATQYSFFSF